MLFIIVLLREKSNVKMEKVSVEDLENLYSSSDIITEIILRWMRCVVIYSRHGNDRKCKFERKFE
jgi:hypothetical protein